MTATLAEPWNRLVGQARAVERMERAAQRPLHSYLLVGSKGADLLTAARCFASALVSPDRDPRTTELVLKGLHPDVVEFEPESTVISVAQAREEIVPEAWASPIETSSARKVLLVLEAERLQLEAENALLKTFEEPPASTVIVLVTLGAEGAGAAVAMAAVILIAQQLDSTRSEQAVRAPAVGDNLGVAGQHREPLLQLPHFFFHLLARLKGYDEFLRHIDALASAGVASLAGRPRLDLKHAEVPQFDPPLLDQRLDGGEVDDGRDERPAHERGVEARRDDGHLAL